MDAHANGAGSAPQRVATAARPSVPAYRRHRPENTVLYRVVEANAEALFAHLDAHDASLARFVHEEFEAYLVGPDERSTRALGCHRIERLG